MTQGRLEHGDGRAVLLMAYGSPGSLEDVEPYYTHVRGGCRPRPERVEDLRARYRAIGGASPLLAITQEQAAALAARLGIPVYVGMKHWHPFIAEAVGRMQADGITRAVAIALAPHYSKISIGGYLAAVEAAAGGAPRMHYVESWHLHPRLIEALAERVARALRRLSDPATAFVVFTAHSLPERILSWGDPYVEQLRETGAAVARAAEVERWSIAFQSASATGEPWLGPDIGDALRTLQAEGVRAVVVCPAGFVADHLEVLYDLDIEARGLAESLEMQFVRTPSLNAAPELIDALAELAMSSLDPVAPRGTGVGSPPPRSRERDPDTVG